MRLAVVVLLTLAVVAVRAVDRDPHNALEPFEAFASAEPLPADRDARAAATLRLLQLLGGMTDGVAPAGASAAKSASTSGATTSARAIGGGAKGTTTVVIHNTSPPPLPGGTTEISFLPGGKTTFWILFAFILVILFLVLLWCCRDILLRPVISCCEVFGYWTYKIVSWPLWRLWDGLQIVAYPMKEGVLAIHESLQRCLHPATKV